MTEKLTDDERNHLVKWGYSSGDKALSIIDALTAENERLCKQVADLLARERWALNTSLGVIARLHDTEARLTEATAIIRQILADDEPRQITGITGETQDRVDAFLANQPAAPYGTPDESPGFNATWPIGEPKHAAPARTEAEDEPPECDNCGATIDGNQAATSDVCHDCWRSAKERTEAEQAVLDAMANALIRAPNSRGYRLRPEDDNAVCRAELARRGLK